ncbi:MAG TPA: VOC family protein [Thermoplasmata archaeon]|nr:VOC family protein [Thermoplasmata archaeon]
MSDVIEGLEAVTVHVTDIQRARKFYSQVLGLKEVSFQENAARAAFEIPGTSTQLTMHIQAEGEGGRLPGTVSGLVFSHRDPVAACAEIRKRGGTIVDEPHAFTNPFATGVRGTFADPDGNEFLVRHVRSISK